MNRYTRRYPNGETQYPMDTIINWIHRLMRRTGRTETSQYPEEKKSTEIPLVAASERGAAQSLNQ